MKKLHSLLLFVLAASALFSQPTLLQTDLLGVGDIVVTQPCDTTNVQPGNAGANQTWDFSQLQPVFGKDTTFYLAPDPTPYFANYPASNIVALFAGNSYGYYQITADELLFFGQTDPTTALVLSDPAVYFKFPATFGTTVTDSIFGTINYGALGGDVAGTVLFEADGYGTLLTPAATYDNVLRIKTITAAQATIPFLGTLVDTVSNYSWYQLGIETPVLEMITDRQFVNGLLVGTTRYINYYLSFATGEKEAARPLHTIQAFPNPATGQVQFSGLSKRSEVVVENMNGQIVCRQTLSPDEALDVSKLAPGAYVCSFWAAGAALHRVKLLVR